MKSIIFCFLLAVCLCNQAITRDFIDVVSNSVTWETTSYEENLFRMWTIDEVKDLMGTHNLHTEVPSLFQSTPKRALPENFDSREKWGKCIHEVRNQAKCGSCWAFGATGALTDRFCINGKDIILSPQYVIECDKNNHCCNGGQLDKVFNFLMKQGTVEEKCLPYDMKCAGCREVNCIHYKCKAGSIWESMEEEPTKQEIYTHGPVEGAFQVYRDFLTYKSGVYYHKAGELLGGHAIEILGWGVEGGLNYWLCKNSWGTTWGMNGYFKIKMGDCMINDNMISCSPQV